MNDTPATAEKPSPPARRQGGWRTTVAWLIVVAIMAVVCWHLEGAAAVEAAADDYVAELLLILPRMSAALLVSGFAQVLVPRGLVTEWLGTGAGVRGIVVAAVVGALTPGGPMLAFPLVIVLRNAGASLASLITFLTSWATLGFHRILMWELPFLGPEFAFVRYVSSIPLGIIAGLTILGFIVVAKRKGGTRT